VTYATIMACMDLDGHDEGLLAVVGDLAERCRAGVVGIAARQPVEMMYGAGRMTGELIEFDREELHKLMHAAEARLRKALSGRVESIDWRGAIALSSLADYVAAEARCADLIVTRPDVGAGIANSGVRLSVGDLVMGAGRPVLIVPPGAAALDLDHALVAWRDTREARRAISDALPLLELAGEVTIVEVADEDRLNEAEGRLEDVVEWLRRHRVTAKAALIAQTGFNVVHLEDVAHSKRAGLMVAGAYGHTRLLEWIMGGVTSDLLLHPGRCTLVSH
jgi:nucleotide-binding universal stress UspA family protein